jgi:hypothetical protein
MYLFKLESADTIVAMELGYSQWHWQVALWQCSTSTRISVTGAPPLCLSSTASTIVPSLPQFSCPIPLFQQHLNRQEHNSTSMLRGLHVRARPARRSLTRPTPEDGLQRPPALDVAALCARSVDFLARWLWALCTADHFQPLCCGVHGDHRLRSDCVLVEQRQRQPVTLLWSCIAEPRGSCIEEWLDRLLPSSTPAGGCRYSVRLLRRCGRKETKVSHRTQHGWCRRPRGWGAHRATSRLAGCAPAPQPWPSPAPMSRRLGAPERLLVHREVAPQAAGRENRRTSRCSWPPAPGQRSVSPPPQRRPRPESARRHATAAADPKAGGKWFARSARLPPEISSRLLWWTGGDRPKPNIMKLFSIGELDFLFFPFCVYIYIHTR